LLLLPNPVGLLQVMKPTGTEQATCRSLVQEHPVSDLDVGSLDGGYRSAAVELKI
jgi:hypothetical protein